VADAGPGSGSADRPAFYALSPGGWRDYWTLLHPPYTLWHLSYVAFGTAAAERFDARRLWATLLAFGLAIGLSAHALDELNGRPLRTRIPSAVLWAIAAAGLAGALGIGVLGVVRATPWLLAYMAVGAFVLVAYNLELLGGRFHSDAWFAAAWGAFPALTAAFAQDEAVRPPHLLVAAACLALSLAQRRLSTPVRTLRRKTRSVHGVQVLEDGTELRLDAPALRAPLESALRAISVAMPLLAAGLLWLRFG